MNNTTMSSSIAANRSHTAPTSSTTHIPTNSFFWRSKPSSDFEFNSQRPLTSVILDVDKPVFTNYAPFNILYMHASEYVIPLDPKDPGYKAGRAFLYLLATCVTVLLMWQVSTAMPIAKPIAVLDPNTEETRLNILREVLSKVSPRELKALGAKADWMTDNFTVNGESIIHRPWTMITSAISHQDVGHLLGNFFSLFLFMPKVYSFLGPRYFAGLYITGAIGCSLAHAGMNWLAGRSQKPYGFVDMLILSERLNEEQMEKAFENVRHSSFSSNSSSYFSTFALVYSLGIYFRSLCTTLPVSFLICVNCMFPFRSTCLLSVPPAPAWPCPPPAPSSSPETASCSAASSSPSLW